MATPLPLIMTESGPSPTDPATIRAALIAGVVATNPGYTANLPGVLIEDIASTCAGALVLIDQARVEFINSVTPFGANAFILNQLGQVYGVQPDPQSNTSVFVVFTGTVGFAIDPGFTVSDGSHSYVTLDGVIIPTGGSTPPVQCVAVQTGSWAVPANSVTTISTSVPTGIALSVTNPNPGTPGTNAETEESYRAGVLGAGLAVCQGDIQFLKTQLRQVPGVQPRLVAIRLITAGWQVLVGGSGDPYAVANAILRGMSNIALLTGSSISSLRNVTVNIDDYPDTYTIVYIAPPAQTVGVTLLWNTTGTGSNFISGAAVASLGGPAIVSYINSIPAGAALNINDLQNAFIDAVAPVLSSVLITRLVWTITINSVIVGPLAGTQLIQGDAEGYFSSDISQINISQG